MVQYSGIKTDEKIYNIVAPKKTRLFDLTKLELLVIRLSTVH